ncbi:MAG: hypothetical protein CL946_09025 [Ectothiorhodospiraceae bacterium]|nr:hypothetical protein [Ectothiorhodospiraceae bacterium]
MQEEANTVHKIADLLKDHWPWLSSAIAGIGFVVYKVYHFFNGINRLADGQSKLVEQVEKIAERQDKLSEKQEEFTREQSRLMDSDGVDARVKPVIDAVFHVSDRVDAIYDRHFNREQNERSGDK